MRLSYILKKDAEAAHSHDGPKGETTEKKTEHEDATLMSLIEQGVTVEDIQVVFNDHPELISAISGGSMVDFAKGADKSPKTPPQGDCLAGQRRGERSSGVNPSDTLSCRPANDAMNLYVIESDAMPSRGGGASYVGWEATESHIVLDIKNRAYNAPDRTALNSLNSEMDNYLRTLQPGAKVSLDEIRDKNVRIAVAKRFSPQFSKKGFNNWKDGTKGGLYGHVATKGNDGNFHCDGTQRGLGCGRYGEYIRVSFPTDASVSGKYVDLILAQRDARLNNPEYEYPEDVRIRKYQPTRLPQEKPQINLRTLAAQKRQNPGVRR